jgi:hypothetical protein
VEALMLPSPRSCNKAAFPICEQGYFAGQEWPFGYEDFAFFRFSAQRFFIISDSRFLAAALMPPRRCPSDLPFPAALLRMLPEELIPLSEAMAWLMRSLSCSNSATILSISNAEPPGSFLSNMLWNRGSQQPIIVLVSQFPYERSRNFVNDPTSPNWYLH